MDIKNAIIFAQKKLKDKDIISASLDAEVLLLAAINNKGKIKRDKSWMYMNAEKYLLSKKEEKMFRDAVKRREKNEPIAYICGEKEFYGLDFFVNKNVLIPRPETEIIVDEAITILKKSESEKRFSLLDIGTGSGCIALSILHEARKHNETGIVKIFANDISSGALKTAKLNARRHKLYSKISFLECDLEKAIEKIGFHKNIIITANLPYIMEGDYLKLGSNVKDFEPKTALLADEKGLYHINRLIKKFASYNELASSYVLLLEADPGQMKPIRDLAERTLRGCKVEILKDLRGESRMIKIYK